MGQALLVLYDRGAASAAEIAVGLAPLGTVAFVVADSAHTRRLRPVLARLGHVVPLTGSLGCDVTRLRDLDPAAILTFSEPLLPITATLADALGLPFHAIDTARLLTDKIQQRQRLYHEGVENVRVVSISSVAEWPTARKVVGLPAVIKPIRGEGSRHTYPVYHDDLAQGLLSLILPVVPESTVVVEELLQGRPTWPFGDYVAVESMSSFHGISHIAVTGKFPLVSPFREAGRFWPAPISPTDRAQITDLVTRALTALEVGVGITHTEVKLTPEGPRIIEVNGRLGGHVHGLASQAADVNLVQLAGRLALGHAPLVPSKIDRPGRVYFQHNTLAPVDKCALIAAYGATEVRRINGVDGFRHYVRPGENFAPDVMTRHLDLLWGQCQGYGDMSRIVRQSLHQLSYEFQFDDGTRQLTAANLNQLTGE